MALFIQENFKPGQSLFQATLHPYCNKAPLTCSAPTLYEQQPDRNITMQQCLCALQMCFSFTFKFFLFLAKFWIFLPVRHFLYVEWCTIYQREVQLYYLAYNMVSSMQKQIWNCANVVSSWHHMNILLECSLYLNNT